MSYINIIKYTDIEMCVMVYWIEDKLMFWYKDSNSIVKNQSFTIHIVRDYFTFDDSKLSFVPNQRRKFWNIAHLLIEDLKIAKFAIN